MAEAAGNIYQQDISILCNQLKRFVVELVKFFCDNQNCDWALIYQQLNVIKSKTQTVINRIEMRRQEIEGARDPNSFHGRTYTQFSSDFLDVESENNDDNYNSSHNPFSVTEFDENGQTIEEEIENSRRALESIHERLVNLRDHIGIDAENAIEGIANVMGTIGNLRRTRNYSNLHGLSE